MRRSCPGSAGQSRPAGLALTDEVGRHERRRGRHEQCRGRRAPAGQCAQPRAATGSDAVTTPGRCTPIAPLRQPRRQTTRRWPEETSVDGSDSTHSAMASARVLAPSLARSGARCSTCMNAGCRKPSRAGYKLPAQRSSCARRNLKPPPHQRLSKTTSKACYPASRLLRAGVPLPAPRPAIHRAPCTGTPLPQPSPSPLLSSGRLASQRPRGRPPSCLCSPPIRSPHAILAVLVFFVLDQHSVPAAHLLPGYHDGLPPSSWPSYPLSAVLKLHYTSMTLPSIATPSSRQ